MVSGEDFAGLEFDDGGVGDREDVFAGMRGADTEVVHSSGAAEGDLAVGVDGVVTKAVVAGIAVAGGGGGGFGQAV